VSGLRHSGRRVRNQGPVTSSPPSPSRETTASPPDHRPCAQVGHAGVRNRLAKRPKKSGVCVRNRLTKSESRTRRGLGQNGTLRMVRYRTLETDSPVRLRPFLSPVLKVPESGVDAAAAIPESLK